MVDFTPAGVRIEGRRGAPEWTWTLESVDSSTGRVLVEAGPVAPVAVEPTLIRYDRCALHEDYRLKEDSFEQLFVIPEPLPLGGEDLVVAGAVSCDGDLAENETGWGWRSARGEVTLGRVSVLDADGEPIPARFEVTRPRPDSWWMAARCSRPPTRSRSTPRSARTTTGSATWAALATRPTTPSCRRCYNSIYNEYLVVWEGDDNSGGLVDDEPRSSASCCRRTGGGVLTNDFRISDVGGTGSAASNARDPDVAFNSTYNQYLVVWSADDPVDGVVDNEFEIWGQVLDADGGGLYTNDFRISSNGGSGNAAYDADCPAVVYNPSRDEYLVVWDGDEQPRAWWTTSTRSGRSGSTPPAS